LDRHGPGSLRERLARPAPPGLSDIVGCDGRANVSTARAQPDGPANKLKGEHRLGSLFDGIPVEVRVKLE
jgi:hypothetical protein